MSKSRRKKAAAAAEASAASAAPSGLGNAHAAPPAPPANSDRNRSTKAPTSAPPATGSSKTSASAAAAAASPPSSRHPNGAAAPAPAAAAAAGVANGPHTGRISTSENATGPRRRRGGGGGGAGGADTNAIKGVDGEHGGRGGATHGSSTAPPLASQHKTGAGHRPAGGGGADGGGGGSGDVSGWRRRIRLWRALQWPLAVAVVLLALAAVPRWRLIEDAPMTVSELLYENLLGPLGPFARLYNLNVSLPPLPPLPRPSLDALIASAGFNVSALAGLTDTLTDTLNDLTDSLSGSRLTVAVRGFLAQLPAFGMPGGGGGGGGEALGPGGGVNGSGAGGGEAGLRPGLLMARRGFAAKHPVVIVPGFVTSGLELWRGLPCGQRYFRQRMWGTLAMLQAFLTDPACWFRHMELDPATGLDPPGIKIRAAVGLEAVDYFIQGYWVWGKLVEALADVGYDSNSLVCMPYDWRLAMPLLEERDGYFTRLRMEVEALVDMSGERVVITAHSYGENVVRSFMMWVEADQPGWVEGHVETIINIAGTSLGVPKAVSALLSGETRDTAQLGALSGFLTSNLVPRATRTRVWRTWGASYGMLPVGGPGVWGNASWAPDDSLEMRAERRTYGAMVSLWPHDWQAVLAAAAAAPPQQREELRRLVHNVSESVEAPQQQQQPQAAEASGGGGGDGGGGGAAATTNSSAAATAAAVSAALLNGGGAGTDSVAAGGDDGVYDRGGSGGGENNSSSTSSNSTGSSGSNSGSGSGSNSSGSSGSSSSGGSSSSPMSRITDTLKRLVSSGGSDIDPADYLDSEHVTRLDVGGFLSLLREVGGALVDAHVREWGAVDMSAARREEAEATGEAARRRATAAADGATAQAAQALGGPQRLRRSVRHRVALFPDATRTPLPNAPTTSILCLYGIGLPTERGYHYLRPPPPSAAAAAPPPQAAAAAAAAAAGAAPEAAAAPQNTERLAATPGEADDGGRAAAAAAAVGAPNAADGGDGTAPPPHNVSASGEESSLESGSEAGGGWAILTDVSDPGSKLDVGVQMSDGDGTVPLLSLGLMCRRGWRPAGRLNPGGMRVVTREYKHRSVSMLQDARGGPATAAHIDILGNEGVLQDVIRVVTGRLDELDDVIHSDIDRMAAEVQFD